MADAAVPQEAIDAATVVLHKGGDVAAMLAAAVPHLAAAATGQATQAERERITALAVEHEAYYVAKETGTGRFHAAWFADLIGEEAGHGHD